MTEIKHKLSHNLLNLEATDKYRVYRTLSDIPKAIWSHYLNAKKA